MNTYTGKMTDWINGTMLLVGASRGLGLGMDAELARREWGLVRAVRGQARTGLHELADAYPGRVEVEAQDITGAKAIVPLRDQLNAIRDWREVSP